jgi:hypothetical protein
MMAVQRLRLFTCARQLGTAFEKLDFMQMLALARYVCCTE